MKDREINRSKHYGAYTLLVGLLVEDENGFTFIYTLEYISQDHPQLVSRTLSITPEPFTDKGAKDKKITMENMCQLTGSLCYLGVSLYKSGKGVPPVTSDTPISHLFFIIKALSCSCLS